MVYGPTDSGVYIAYVVVRGWIVQGYGQGWVGELPPPPQ